MRKKINLLLMLIIGMFPFNVYALTGNTTVSCSKTNVVPGEEITCTLKGNASAGEVTSLSSKISASSNLTIGAVTVDSIWEGTDEANLDLYTDENKTGTFAIATFKVQVSKSISGSATGTITIDSTRFFDENFEEVTINDTTQNIKILSTINTLNSLSVEDETLVPEFKSDTLNYSVSTTATKATISAKATDSKAKVTGDVGEVNLNYGTNTFRVNVTSESGSVKTYTIQITRPDDRSTDNTLSSITVNEKEIELVDGVYEYVYEVENDVTEVDIYSVLNDELADYVEGYEPRTVKLEDGKAIVEIRVKAENEDVQVYKITVATKKIVESNQLGTDGDSTNTKKEELTNPKTGRLQLYIIFMILVVSISFIIYYQNIYLKKVGDK